MEREREGGGGEEGCFCLEIPTPITTPECDDDSGDWRLSPWGGGGAGRVDGARSGSDGLMSPSQRSAGCGAEEQEVEAEVDVVGEEGGGSEEGDEKREEQQEGEEEQEEEVSEDTLLDYGYRVLSILGHGNFSTTYLAEEIPQELDPPPPPQQQPDPPLRLVAIKRMKRPFGAIGENEYSLLEFLHSDAKSPRHIISPISSFSSATEHFHIVLERLDSGRPVSLVECRCEELHSKLACPQRHRSLAKILLQLLSGLLSLHSHNLIHADLTPANILFLPSSNRIKLIDLGNAIRPEDREAYLDDFGVQSVCYRAPEILLGQGPLSRVMDVWSAGVIGVELLADGEVVGNGLEGVELVRSRIEGRKGMVTRLVELVGSVADYQDGMYYLDIYDEISLEPPVVFSPKKRRKRGVQAQPAADLQGRDGAEAPRLPKKGMLGPFLAQETADFGLSSLLTDMMEVDVAKRKTVWEMLRHPWLVDSLLGDWGCVLMSEVTGGGEPSEELEEAEDEEEGDPGDEDKTLVNDDDGHEDMLEEAKVAPGDPQPEKPGQDLQEAPRTPTPQPEPAPTDTPQSSDPPPPEVEITPRAPADSPEPQASPSPESLPPTPQPQPQPPQLSSPDISSSEVEVEIKLEEPSSLPSDTLPQPPPSPAHLPSSSSIPPTPESPSPVEADDAQPQQSPSTPPPPPPPAIPPTSPILDTIEAPRFPARTSDIWHRDLAAEMVPPPPPPSPSSFPHFFSYSALTKPQGDIYQDEDEDEDQVMLC